MANPNGSRDFIIHDTTPDGVLFPGNRGRGLDLTGRPGGYANGLVADPFPDNLIIPRSDWQGMIEEQEVRQNRIPDLCDAYGISVKDQKNTCYCWFNSPTHAVEIIRGIQNQAHISLSPASGAARSTNYANSKPQSDGSIGEGGIGIDALKWIIQYGLVPSELWPDNEISPAYATPLAAQEALKYRVDEWWELEPRNLDQLVSCLLLRFPICIGLDWWGHEVTAVAAKWIDGEVAIEIDNSWGTGWGVNGRGVLQGKRMLPDDAVAPRTAFAS